VARKGPLHDVSDNYAAAQLILGGWVPKLPKNTPVGLAEVFSLCCQQEPWSRPEFDIICEYLAQEI